MKKFNTSFSRWPMAIAIMVVTLVIGVLIYLGRIKRVEISNEKVVIEGNNTPKTHPDVKNVELNGAYYFVFYHPTYKVFYEFQIVQNGSEFKGKGRKIGDEPNIGRFRKETKSLGAEIFGRINGKTVEITMTEISSNNSPMLHRFTVTRTTFDKELFSGIFRVNVPVKVYIKDDRISIR